MSRSTDRIRKIPPGHYNKFALSNVGDWMTQEEMKALFRLIGAHSEDRARLLLRYIHYAHPLAAELKQIFTPDPELGSRLESTDRYPFYSLLPIQIHKETGAGMTGEFISGIHEIDKRWNGQMLSLVKQSPIEANGLKLVFDRSPDIFLIPGLRSVAVRCAGFFLQKQLCGFAMMLHKDLFVRGTPRKVLYFGNLVIDRQARGKVFLYRMSDFFLGDFSAEDSFGHTVILKGNDAAKRLREPFPPGISKHPL